MDPRHTCKPSVQFQLAILTLAFTFLLTTACSQPSANTGTTIHPPEPSPSFHLRDQFGNQRSLTDFSGRIIVITFLYTGCPDICPVLASKFHSLYDLLGQDAQHVNLVAISVDPERDTQAQAHYFSNHHDMLHKWHFLVGTRETLEPIWKAYWVAAAQEYPQASSTQRTAGQPKVTTDNNKQPTSKSLNEFSATFTRVSHSTPIFLIDQQGQQRVVYTSNTLDLDLLVRDIRLLIQNPPQ